MYYPHLTLGQGGHSGGGAVDVSVCQSAISYQSCEMHGEEGGAGEAVHGLGSVACYQQSVSQHQTRSFLLSNPCQPSTAVQSALV